MESTKEPQDWYLVQSNIRMLSISKINYTPLHYKVEFLQIYSRKKERKIYYAHDISI
jgi:hypothetical protein